MLPLLLAACTSPSPEDTAGSSNAITADTASDDTGAIADTGPADSGDPEDTAVVLQGLSGQRGTATVGANYQGVDERYFVADRGRGEDVCRLSYTVTSTGTRDDCIGDEDACDWAFDVVYGAPTMTADSVVGCSGVGIDPTAIEGTVAGYGYVADYYGHTSVLMVDDGGVWNPATFASFDRGAFEYDWEYGLVEY